jgi:hypothetical protein
VQGLLGELASEIVELALGAAADELALLDGTDAGRIIAAIFEAFQPIEQPLRNVALTNNPDNSAHRSNVLGEQRRVWPAPGPSAVTAE